MKLNLRDIDWGEAAFGFVMACLGVLVLCFAACVLRVAITGENPSRRVNAQQQVELRIK